MRIQELDLKRYGKFTDQRMEFPAAARDFHFVVGANEAGKSTTRSAILDLLFGIETRSNYDFLHAKADMRLGASLMHAGASLQFERSKARSKTLFDARGQALPEAALAAFLGASDRNFFDQMFGLDHGRLEAGGKAILSASNDLGQILFQSAAGIGSLATVRERLDAEADKLWAKRRSSDRAYYVASDELAAADAALKAHTVRTKEWLEARAKVEDLAQARAELRGRLNALELQRSALERVRRVAPALRQRQAVLASLAAMGGTAQVMLLLPADAACILSEAELEMAGATRTQELFTAQALAAAERLAAVRVDETLLSRQSEILALERSRQQVRGHGPEIQRCQSELTQLWQQIEAELQHLAWAQMDEAALAARLPTLPARSAFAALARNFSLLDQASRHAAAAAADKNAELLDLQAQALGQTSLKLPASLDVALSQARALGDVRATSARQELALARAGRELLNARAGLGRWDRDVAALRAISLPAEAPMQQRLQRELDLQVRQRSLTQRQAELQANAAALSLEIAQYAQAHRPVVVAELAQAREQRDAQWQRIKQGEADLLASAAGFEASVVQADGMADQRYAKAREVSELQAKQDALERLHQQQGELALALSAHATEALTLDAEWRLLSAGLGLEGLAAAELSAWRQARQRVLDAHEQHGSAEEELQAGAKLARQARADLSAALAAAQLGFEPSDALETLMSLAAEAIAAAATATVRVEALGRQIEAARRSTQQWRDKQLAAQAEFERWQGAWGKSLQEIGLPASLPADAAEVVCAALLDIDQALQRRRELRLGRIEPMQREVADFDAELARCAQALGLSLTAAADASVQQLMRELSTAQAGQQEAQRLRLELAEFERSAAGATLRLAEAAARLQPLLRQAGVSDVPALRASIAASDQRRVEGAALQAAETLLAEGGDGFSITDLAAEVAATDAAQMPLLAAELARQIAELQTQGEGLATEMNRAQTELGLIAGQDDAAQAEGQRQDALAKMANAAERYVKVYTAARLLKWAIDRYRETKQGPMLGRAGEIFAALTLGSFQRLSVDFEAQPLTLHGLRADGRLVEVSGMSEGTRDQLFMALRLAALELHIAQDPIHALPFVADDLFINYDDGRAEAGLRALADLSERTQVIFLSHHAHLLPAVQAVFGAAVNVIRL